MKNFWLAASVFLVSSTGLMIAQNTPASNKQVMGRGRGGAPYAWNDKNKDGICDITGGPVGQQGRGSCARRGQGRGRGAGGGWRRGMGRAQPQPAVPAPNQN